MFAQANTAHFSLLIPNVRNDFKVLAFNGKEAISQLYAIRIELVSENSNIDLESLLCQPAFLQFGHKGEGLHGHIEEVYVGESGKRLTRYSVSLVPALHYLQFSQNPRIFQHLSVPHVLAKVLGGHGIQADAYAFNVHHSPVREYCTQYAETDFEFLQRLCAEEGIAWHHQHSKDGHLLVFTDTQTYFPLLGETPYQQGTGTVADHPVIQQFSQRLSTRTSTVTRREYDLKRPSLLLQSTFTADVAPALEDYQYPALIDTEKRGMQLARQALERHRSDYRLAEGHSDQPVLRSGHFFTLTQHPRKACNDLWLLLSVHHEGLQPQALEESVSSDVQPADGFTQGYRNQFSAIPWDVFYRPPLTPPRPPLVTQTARVTGPEGQEIFCDELGRVRIELPWDRAELDSDKSSCWVRVSSSWAGKHFGASTLPRVGMEVVVTYVEGDPDKPLITGCVPNTSTPVPYPLPANKTRTVMRSHSSPHTGGYNELSIEDRAGQEKIFLRAQRDLEHIVLNDSDTKIGRDRAEHITRDSRSLIDNDRFEQVGGNSTSLIKGNEQHTTQGLRDTVIEGNEQLSVTGNSSTQVDGTWVMQGGAHAHVTATHVVINAGASLTLSAGGQHIVINGGGIFSSVPIVVGGAPVPGVAPLQAAQAQAIAAKPLIAPTLAALMKASKAKGTDFCPLCEACKDGVCLPQGATS